MKTPLIILAVLIVLLGIFYLIQPIMPVPPNPDDELPPPPVEEPLTLQDPLRRFSMSYSDDYFVWMPVMAGQAVEDYTVQFFEDTPENRSVVEGEASEAPGREGPMAITVNVYPKKPTQDLASWIEATPESNFQLGDKKTVASTLAGREALGYHWSGLYEGDSLAAILNEEEVLVMSVTYISPDDKTYQDWQKFVSGFSWGVPPLVLDSITVGSEITSPLTITGKMLGPWFFEASFPITLVDWDGRIIAETFAQAEGEWMTTDYVPFTTTLTFTPPPGNIPRGAIIFKKDNPSGLPEHDDAIELPIRFK